MECRFVVMLAKQHDYFFVLYVVKFAAEGWLAVLALFHHPSMEHTEPLPEDPDCRVYEVPDLAGSNSSAKLMSSP